MIHSKANSNTQIKILVSLPSLVSVGECFFIFLFYPFLKSLNIPLYAYLPPVVFGVAAAVALMPFIYSLINSSNLLPTGKYHLPLVLSMLGLSFMLGIIFTLNPLLNTFGKITALFFAALFLFVSYLVYTYVCSSIGTRLPSSPEAKKEKVILAFIGSEIFCITLIITQLFMQAPEVSAAAICASIVLLTGFSVYLSTYKFMPRFIRLKEAKKRDAKLTFIRFFLPFTIKDNRRAYINLFFCTAAFLSLALTVFPLCERFTLNKIEAVAGIIIFFAASSIIRLLATGKELSEKIKLVALILALVFGVCVLIFMYVNLPQILIRLVPYFLPVLLGVSCGLYYSRSEAELDEVKERSNATAGIIVCTKNTVMAAAFLFSLIAVSVSGLLNELAPIGAIGFFMVTIFVSGLISFAKKRYLTLEIPDEDV